MRRGAIGSLVDRSSSCTNARAMVVGTGKRGLHENKKARGKGKGARENERERKGKMYRKRFREPEREKDNA